MTNFIDTVIYIGVTNNLIRRVYEHRNHLIEGFTSKYNVNKWMYFEEYGDSITVIERKKQLKAGPRKKKIDLIVKDNPKFDDLYKSLL